MKPSLRVAFPLLLVFLFSLNSCESFLSDSDDENNNPPVESGDDTVMVFYTNDEHGWILREEGTGGAAEMSALWKQMYDYQTDGDFLVLSGGDMWTGAAISTWFNGQPVVDVMNAMGYDAAALGNHEYDFGPDTLLARAQQMHFPILAANVIETATGEPPAYVQPYTLVEEAGHTIGIVGLANRATYEINFPDNVAGLEFGEYETALSDAVPEAFDAGAEAVVVIAHISSYEMRNLAPVAADLGVILLGGGHTNEYIQEVYNNVGLVMANTAFNVFGATKLIFRESGAVSLMTPWLISNDQPGSDPDIESVIDPWEVLLDAELGVVIGYASETITARSHYQSNMILDSWLLGPWGADIAISNTGGFRADIPAGDITKATIVSVLPFENDLVMLTLSGEQVMEYVNGLGGVVRVGGITMVGTPRFLDGNPLHPDSLYEVLTTDYLYDTSEGETYDLTSYDSDPFLTSTNFRDPFIDWIEGLNTSASDPLNDYGDPEPRQ